VADDSALDPALDALHALRDALGATDEWLHQAVKRTSEIESFRDRGYSWQEVLSTEDRPLMTDNLHRHITQLVEVNSRFRREEVRSLYKEGVKVEDIADIFGVTVAQIEAMLSDAHGFSG
jgi:DNA-directed RNA polymerase specialized sigma24 family protein